MQPSNTARRVDAPARISAAAPSQDSGSQDQVPEHTEDTTTSTPNTDDGEHGDSDGSSEPDEEASAEPIEDEVIAPPEPGIPTSFRAEAVTAEIGGCPLFTVDHYQNARFIDRLPVHPKSDAWIQSIINAKPDANIGAPTSRVIQGSRSGFPLNVVDSRVTGKEYVLVHGELAELGWTGHYPMPKSPRVEGYPSIQWDQHLFVIDQADCTAYELIMFEPRLKGLLTPFYSAEFGVKYSLNTSEAMRYTTNSPNTPMVSQYARPSEASEDRIDHALSFCLNTISTEHVWPARDSDGRVNSPDTIPMGAWVRLKANVDLSGFHGQGKVIAQALKEHGMILTDSCGRHFGLMVENSADWIDSEVAALATLTPHLFEVVDTSPMKISDTSHQIR